MSGCCVYNFDVGDVTDVILGIVTLDNISISITAVFDVAGCVSAVRTIVVSAVR